jgi:predicted N-acyltransferase
VLWRQLSAADVRALPGRLRLVRPTEQVALLPVAGLSTRDDWLAGLSRNRRKNLRKVFRAVEADPDLEITVGPGHDADPVAVAEVLRHNETKYRHRFGPLPQATGYLAVLLDRPDVLAFRYTDRTTRELLAVVTLFDHPEWPLARHWSAMPVERGGRPGLYFHYYGAALAWAIAAGKQGVVVGKGMPELKESLGARLVEQYVAAVPVR